MMRIHFHTDCYTFSGSEITLVLLLEAAAMLDGVDSRFTFVSRPEYDAGLRARITDEVEAVALAVIDPALIKARFIGDRGRASSVAVRGIAKFTPLRQVALISSVRRMTTLFRQERPDIVHINNGGFPGAISCNAAAIAARRANVPVVVYVVNNLARGYNRPSRVADFPADRAVRKSVTRFVTGSNAAGAVLDRVLHLPGAQRTVIPNSCIVGLPDESLAATRARLGVGAGAPVLAVIGLLEKRKGHLVLLEALARLLTTPRGETPVLLVAGDGPEGPRLRLLADRLGISQSVRMLGHQRNVWNILQVADLLVLPSIADEDFPVVILEAMAAGKPVVASRVAGVPEQIVDGETGVIVPAGDVQTLAEALGRVLADGEKMAKMGRAGGKRFRELFSPSVVTDHYFELYRDLLASSRSSVVGRAR
jgi:glycosyltransferase involved in cell wall biosynthesis